MTFAAKPVNKAQTGENIYPFSLGDLKQVRKAAEPWWCPGNKQLHPVSLCIKVGRCHVGHVCRVLCNYQHSLFSGDCASDVGTRTMDNQRGPYPCRNRRKLGKQGLCILEAVL